MKDIDFLESLEGESLDNFNWGVRRPGRARLVWRLGRTSNCQSI